MHTRKALKVVYRLLFRFHVTLHGKSHPFVSSIQARSSLAASHAHLSESTPSLRREPGPEASGSRLVELDGTLCSRSVAACGSRHHAAPCSRARLHPLLRESAGRASAPRRLPVSLSCLCGPSSGCRCCRAPAVTAVTRVVDCLICKIKIKPQAPTRAGSGSIIRFS